MAKNNAQRQAAYRARHLKDLDGKGERLNLVIDLHAKRAIERLAICYGVTQKDIIERLVLGAQRVTLDRAATLPKGPEDYYDGRLRFGYDDVTQ
jgi:hypothetical protein